jgi:hypothetical protein
VSKLQNDLSKSRHSPCEKAFQDFSARQSGGEQRRMLFARNRVLAHDAAMIEQSGDFCTSHQKRTLLHGLFKIPRGHR